MNRKLYTKCITPVGSTLKDNSKWKLISYFSFELPNSRLLIPFSILFLSLFSSALYGKIGIIVNKSLYSSIQNSISTYIADVNSIEKKDVWLEKDNFDETNTPQELKDALKDHYQDDNLEGAILIGDLPIAKYSMSGETCDLYYMDMDGSWSGTGSTFSNHSGNKEGEIWISRITASVLESYFDDETTMVNEYFAKVTKRMHGQDPMERKYVIAGQKSEWGGLEAENQGDLGYDPSNIDIYTGSCGSQWGAALVDGREYGFVYSHSSATMHAIGYNISKQASDDMDCRFFNSYACSNALITRANMCGAYALADAGLICVGSSKSGSMCPGSFRAYNRPLGAGKSFGDAFLDWFNEEGIQNASWHYGMHLQGAGTLALEKYASGPYLTVNSPNGSEEWEQGNTYTIKWGSNVSGNVKIELLKGGAVAKELAGSAENNGLFEVEITKDFEVGDDYKIRISSLEIDTILSESAENFTIMEEFIIAEFPYIIDFDELDKGSTILPRKWEQLTTDDLNWTVWSGKTPSKEPDQGAATGPDGDKTSGSGMYIYVESSSPNNPDKKADYVTPKINFSHLTDPTLTFWYHMFSDNEGADEMGHLYLDISVDGTWQNDVLHLEKDHGDEWFSETIDLTSYKGERVIFQFRAVTGSGWASDICIDDFVIDGATPVVVIPAVPLSYGIQNYGSRIVYQVPESHGSRPVSIKLYSIQGKLICTLVKGPVGVGNHSISLERYNLGSGLYFCRMAAGDFTQTRRVLLKK